MVLSYIRQVKLHPDPGLCATCAWCRTVRNRRGSEFRLCERSREEAAFVKYPPQPVVDCPGFESRKASSSSD